MTDFVRPFDRICVPVRLKVSTRMSQDVYGYCADHHITMAEAYRRGMQKLIEEERQKQ
jgi:hypothetical protein